MASSLLTKMSTEPTAIHHELTTLCARIDTAVSQAPKQCGQCTAKVAGACEMLLASVRFYRVPTPMQTTHDSVVGHLCRPSILDVCSSGPPKSSAL